MRVQEFRIAISDCDHKSISEEHKVFDREGLIFDKLQLKTEQQLIEGLADYDLVMNQTAHFTARVIAALPKLKLIVRYGVGLDNIDIDAASEAGVRVCNVPDYGTHEVAAQALAFMLAFTRKLIPMTESVCQGHWNYELSIPIRRLKSMTVGVIGIGRIGKSFAEMVRPLAGRILGVDPRYGKRKDDHPEYIELVDLESVLRESDVVSIHCPLETARNLINSHTLSLMKPSAYLINVSRGGIIDELALATALKEGKLAGAGIDVTQIEPLPMASPLREAPNFLCTPHMAWYSEQASSDLKTKVAEEIVRFVRREPLLRCINEAEIKEKYQ